MKTSKVRPVPWGLLAGVSVLVGTIGGGAAWWISHPGTLPWAKPANPLAPAVQGQVQVFWLQVQSDKKVTLTHQSLNLTPGTSPEAALRVAFNQLLSGPLTDGTTSIPANTRLLSLQVKPGEVYVDLSQDFTQGGGSSSMIGRVGQVLYTATSLDPQAKVFLAIEGRPASMIAGEGLVIGSSMTRDEFSREFSFPPP